MARVLRAVFGKEVDNAAELAWWKRPLVLLLGWMRAVGLFGASIVVVSLAANVKGIMDDSASSGELQELKSEMSGKLGASEAKIVELLAQNAAATAQAASLQRTIDVLRADAALLQSSIDLVIEHVELIVSGIASCSPASLAPALERLKEMAPMLKGMSDGRNSLPSAPTSEVTRPAPIQAAVANNAEPAVPEQAATTGSSVPSLTSGQEQINVFDLTVVMDGSSPDAVMFNPPRPDVGDAENLQRVSMWVVSPPASPDISIVRPDGDRVAPGERFTVSEFQQLAVKMTRLGCGGKTHFVYSASLGNSLDQGVANILVAKTEGATGCSRWE